MSVSHINSIRPVTIDRTKLFDLVGLWVNRARNIAAILRDYEVSFREWKAGHADPYGPDITTGHL